MIIAIQVPIRARSSTRAANKNFRDLAGKPLSYWLLDELIEHCPPHGIVYLTVAHHHCPFVVADGIYGATVYQV